MKLTSVFAGAVGGLFLAGTASAALQSVSMELVNVGDQGSTYSMFANLDAGARVDAVYGNSVGTLSIATANGATMYQNANGGPT